MASRDASQWSHSQSSSRQAKPQRDNDHHDPLPSEPLSRLQELLYPARSSASESEFPDLVSYERFVALMPLSDKLLLRKRAIIESVYDQLKDISQIEHTRHRSLANFMWYIPKHRGVNLLSGLVAYCHQAKKPSLNIQRAALDLVPYP